MKKILSVVLVLTIVLGLCACGGSGNADQETQPKATVLEAGFGRENITPDWTVGMAGYSDSETRKTKNILDYIYLTCVAFREGETTILVYTADMTALSQENQKKLREHVAQFTGIPNENIFMGATHTHSSCSPNVDDKWDRLLQDSFVKAANTAMADLAPIKMEVATDTLEGLNFVRHYLMNDGTYYGSNFGSEASGYKAHALEYPDRQLIVLKLDRETKKDILMVNWQAHPASAAREYDYTAVSADFVGPLRAKVESETNMHVAYYTGAAGNTNKDSRIESEKHGLDFKQYGQKIADHVLENLNNLKPVEGTGIKTSRMEFQAEVDHSWDHMIKEANEVFDLWKSVNKTEGDKLGATYGFTSVYQARAIRTRYDLPATQPRELRAFRVGPIGFTTGTYEMFSDHAEYVKQNSPFDITFIITGCGGYIANKAAYEYRSYETDTGMFASGTGEKMAEEYVKLLNAVK